MASVASLVGERLFFAGDNSSGVTGDLHAATATTTYMEGYFGMGSSIGSHAVTKSGMSSGVGYAVEDGTDRMLLETDLGRRVEERLKELYERTERLLEGNRAEVLAVAHALETYRTLHGEDVVAIIEGTAGPLIDGRPYHTPEARHGLETYHAEALRAHQAYGAIDVALPILAPFEPAAAGTGNGERPNGGARGAAEIAPLAQDPPPEGAGSGPSS
jgi:hypothetical protein